MGNMMELSNETLETIGGYVRRNLGAWIQEVAPRMVTDRELLEDLNRNSTRWFTVLTVMVGIIGLSGLILPLLP